MKFIYTDIDGVLALGSEYKNRNTSKWGYIYNFNKKAVKIYNEILEETGAYPIISSDWKFHYTLEQLKEIFTEWAKISVEPVDITPNLPGITVQRLEEFRAKEILKHVEKYKPEAWVAIDDLDLSQWISSDHFVHLPRWMEGIKQSGKKKKIIEKLNINIKT
jgi:hypothetical protein